MKDKDLKLKNIKDLEYNHLLNKQNVFLIIFGTAIISTILADKVPGDVPKWGLVLAFILAIILSLLHYSKKIEDKLGEIKNL